jgi:protein SMG6
VIELIQPLESRLKYLVENCDYKNFKDSSEHINDLRNQLERLCLEAILTHIEISTKLNIDLNYWRLSYHQIIENLRKEYNYALNTLKDGSYSAQLKKFSDSYINEGFEFYESFIKKIEETYNFDKNLYLDLNKVKPTTTVKNVKLALLCINRCLICLGDLSRYRELFNEIKDYSLARSYYLKAMYIAPKCSRAYNQLAILALYTRRRLDAVYYYMRCLELNQPLLTARQSLISLFDEARKRSEIISENLNKKKAKTPSNNSNNSNRIELWHKPMVIEQLKLVDNTKPISNSDGEELYLNQGIDDDNNNDLLNLSSNELNKRFMHDYLNLIGKLFTKVGMESYSEVCSRMLYEFRELLKRDNCPIGKMRLIQITIINISIVSLTKTIPKQNGYQLKLNKSNNYDDSEDDSSTVKQFQSDNIIVQRSQLQEFGVQLCLDMFAIIVKRLTNLLATSNNSGLMDNKIKEIFPSVKLFSDWMKQDSNVGIWLPLPDQLPPDLGPNLDLFQSISNFLNEIGKIDTTCINFFMSQNENGTLIPVVLDEDRETTGFLPLDLPIDKEIVYAQVEDLNDIEICKDYHRFNKMCRFADFLCNIKKQQVIKYDIMNRIYIAIKNNLMGNNSTEEIENENNKDSIEKESTEVVLDKNLSELKLNQSVADEEMNDLIEKRKNLKAKVDEKLKRDQNLQTFVDSTVNRRIELEIRPRFLVPDTNCFIDHLDLIECLLKSTRFIIVVPLIVINELDKLAKSISNYNDDSIEHAEYVQRNAKKSMTFLNEKFENRERYIKAMTSQGSVLETIQFRSEEVKANAGTNDDLILGCCLYYCKDNPRDYMPKDKSKNFSFYLILS